MTQNIEKARLELYAIATELRRIGRDAFSERIRLTIRKHMRQRHNKSPKPSSSLPVTLERYWQVKRMLRTMSQHDVAKVTNIYMGRIVDISNGTIFVEDGQLMGKKADGTVFKKRMMK